MKMIPLTLIITALIAFSFVNKALARDVPGCSISTNPTEIDLGELKEIQRDNEFFITKHFQLVIDCKDFERKLEIETKSIKTGNLILKVTSLLEKTADAYLTLDKITVNNNAVIDSTPTDPLYSNILSETISLGKKLDEKIGEEWLKGQPFHATLNLRFILFIPGNLTHLKETLDLDEIYQFTLDKSYL